MWNAGRGKHAGTPLPSLRSRWDSRSTRCGNSRGGGRSVVGRSGGITAGTLDYFGWLGVASVWALVSAVVTAMCFKYEERPPAWFWAAAFFGSALAAAYCLGKLL